MAKQTNGAAQRWNEDEARVALAAWARSGESGAAFARRTGIDPQRLFWWRRRLESSPTKSEGLRGGGVGEGRAFVPVVMRVAESDAVPAAITVQFGGEARLEVHDVSAASAAWIATVIAAVSGRTR